MTKIDSKPIHHPMLNGVGAPPPARRRGMLPRTEDVEVVYRHDGRTYVRILDGRPDRALLVDRIDGRVLKDAGGGCPTPAALDAMIAGRIVTRRMDLDPQSFPSVLFRDACADFLHLVERTRIRVMRSPTDRSAGGRRPTRR